MSQDPHSSLHKFITYVNWLVWGLIPFDKVRVWTLLDRCKKNMSTNIHNTEKLELTWLTLDISMVLDTLYILLSSELYCRFFDLYSSQTQLCCGQISSSHSSNNLKVYIRQTYERRWTSWVLLTAKKWIILLEIFTNQ